MFVFFSYFFYYSDKFAVFLPMRPLRGAWVNRWTFSPPPPLSLLSNLQLFVPTRPKKAQVFVSLRYRKRREGGQHMGFSLSMGSCFLIVLCFVIFYVVLFCVDFFSHRTRLEDFFVFFVFVFFVVVVTICWIFFNNDRFAVI